MAINATITGGTVQLTGNPILINCDGANAPAGATKYKIMLRIISEDGKLQGAPFHLAKKPDANGEAKFDISGYVDQYVKAEFQYPVIGFMTTYPTKAFNVQVQPGESYFDSLGNLVENWEAINPTIIQMLKGGTNPRQISMMNDANSSFFELYIQGDKFLTARPWAQTVHPTQFIKLWYMVDLDKIDVVFNINARYDDGSNVLFETDPFAMSKDNLYEFNCNPALHGIELEPDGKQVEFFDVWLSGGNTSQSRRFYFDWKYCERPIFLFFKNSLGGIDDVYFSGYINDAFVTEGSVGEFPFVDGNSVYDPTLVPISKTGVNKWILNSGWKTLTDVQYYRDLMLAQQAWYLYSGLSGLTFNIIPILISNADKALLDRMNQLHSFDLEITEAHKSPFVFDNRSF